MTSTNRNASKTSDTVTEDRRPRKDEVTNEDREAAVLREKENEFRNSAPATGSELKERQEEVDAERKLREESYIEVTVKSVDGDFDDMDLKFPAVPTGGSDVRVPEYGTYRVVSASSDLDRGKPFANVQRLPR